MNSFQFFSLIFISTFLMIYFFYNFFLYLFSLFISKDQFFKSFEPNVSILIPVKNEEVNILNKINNVINQNYNLQKISLFFFSDGSTDNTLNKLYHYKNYFKNKVNIKIQYSDFPKGRAYAHNQMINSCKDDYIIFTDCMTKFDTNFIKEIVKPLSVPENGIVVGNLSFIKLKNFSSNFEKIYFEFEKKIRHSMSHLGILMTGTGAAMAINRNIYQKLALYEDIDDSLPIIARLNNYFVKYCPNAKAQDIPSESDKDFFNSRSRMVSKGLSAIFKYFNLKIILKNPMLFFNIFFHKIFRWSIGLLFLILLLIFFKFYFLISILLIFFFNRFLSLFNINFFLFKILNMAFLIAISLSYGIYLAIFKKTKSSY